VGRILCVTIKEQLNFLKLLFTYVNGIPTFVVLERWLEVDSFYV